MPPRFRLSITPPIISLFAADARYWLSASRFSLPALDFFTIYATLLRRCC